MIVNHVDKTISIKIVYFGPAFSGKTTTIKALFSIFGRSEEICSIESTVNRTLYFDYGTVTFENQEWKLKLHIYTTTGQDFYLITRLTTLRAVDGIIFVADSQKDVYERNILSWKELYSYFSEYIEDIPIIIAFNKQDLEFDLKLNTSDFLRDIEVKKFKKIDSRNTSATMGEGILECFEDVLQLVLKKYYRHKLVAILN
ncbi:MAG: GTP-binding protein [Promethearchaeota archaeon]